MANSSLYHKLWFITHQWRCCSLMLKKTDSNCEYEWIPTYNGRLYQCLLLSINLNTPTQPIWRVFFYFAPEKKTGKSLMNRKNPNVIQDILNEFIFISCNNIIVCTWMMWFPKIQMEQVLMMAKVWWKNWIHKTFSNVIEICSDSLSIWIKVSAKLFSTVEMYIWTTKNSAKPSI